MCANLNLRILGITTCLALQGCAGVLDIDDALAVAPYHIEDGGRIVVEARLNGQGPYDFVLDTAASISAVFDSPRKELALEPIPGKFVLIHGVVASGKHALLDIERLAVGSEVWANPRIVSLPGETEAGTSIDGVLGVDFLRQYAVGFSTRDRVIRLYPPDLVARRAYRGWASVPMRVRPIGNGGPTVYFIDVEIDGWHITAVFDLGAGFNMINWPGVLSLGITPRKLRRDTLLSGALESSPLVAWLEAEEVTTARIRWRNEEFSIADVDIFETLMLSDRPAAILGAGLFTQRDFVIDFVRSRLLVNVAMDEVDETR
ncbi:MAG: retroviral-like aspartic protease family protein [Gammaproteobacteria bacterium]|nr:retroviral-like aspartic protease family protein [Gammaproteobacteria bacterium]